MLGEAARAARKEVGGGRPDIHTRGKQKNQKKSFSHAGKFGYTMSIPIKMDMEG